MKTIGSYLQLCVEEGAFPGASWQIGTRDSVMEAGTVGTLGCGLRPVQTDSQYELASVA